MNLNIQEEEYSFRWCQTSESLDQTSNVRCPMLRLWAAELVLRVFLNACLHINMDQRLTLD